MKDCLHHRCLYEDEFFSESATNHYNTECLLNDADGSVVDPKKGLFLFSRSVNVTGQLCPTEKAHCDMTWHPLAGKLGSGLVHKAEARGESQDQVRKEKGVICPISAQAKPWEILFLLDVQCILLV